MSSMFSPGKGTEMSLLRGVWFQASSIFVDIQCFLHRLHQVFSAAQVYAILFKSNWSFLIQKQEKQVLTRTAVSL